VEDAEMDQEADRADITASLAGDGEAYRRIVGRHQSSIARRMRRFTRDAATVEELVQDVFVEAYFSLRGFSGRAPFEHWLNRIATRVGYAFLKKRQKQMKTSGNAIELENCVAAESVNPDEAAETLHRLLDLLPPRDRLVVTLMYLENRSVADTAALIGWSQAMVKVQAFRARSKLRKLLKRTS
jgi:RNA polymerase sigma-70 factor, ECF subfamily